MAFQKAGPSGDFPPSWAPEVGEKLTGTVIEAKTANTVNGPRNLLVVETDEGPMTVWIGAGLTSLYESVKLGSLVDITFEGTKIAEKSGRPFKAYDAYFDNDGVA